MREEFYCQFPACRKAPQARFKMCFAHRRFETSSTSAIIQAWLASQRNESRKTYPTIAEANERAEEAEMSDADFLRSCGIQP